MEIQKSTNYFADILDVNLDLYRTEGEDSDLTHLRYSVKLFYMWVFQV